MEQAETLLEPMKRESIDFRILADDAPVMLWLMNRLGEKIFSNNSHKSFLGYKKITMPKSNAWLKAIHQDDHTTCHKIIADAFQSRQAFVMKYRLKRHDGQYRYIQDQAQPYINQRGKFEGFTGTSTDITALVSLDNKFKKAHQQRFQYADELNTINTLSSSLQACRDLPETYPILARYLEQLFPDWTGHLYFANADKTLMTSKTTWGRHKGNMDKAMAFDECLALNQGTMHDATKITDRSICHHVREPINSYVCVPVIA